MPITVGRVVLPVAGPGPTNAAAAHTRDMIVPGMEYVETVARCVAEITRDCPGRVGPPHMGKVQLRPKQGRHRRSRETYVDQLITQSSQV